MRLGPAPETRPRDALKVKTRSPFLGATAVNLSPAVVEELQLDMPAQAQGDGVIIAQAYSPAQPSAANQVFVKDYRAQYKKDPPQFAAQAYAGVQVLRAAVAMGKGTSATAVQRGLGRIVSTKTVLGTIRFPGSSREAAYPATVQQVAGGKLVLAP